MTKVLILGAGYTGSRVAAILNQAGHNVTSIRRSQMDFTRHESIDELRRIASPDALVLHSIPSLECNADVALLQGLEGKAARIVYFSTTGVYGDAEHVDETTPIAPRNPREQARAATEAAVQRGLWQTLILRPAAIYGPDRG
ncbi:MAG: NAD-dependent epimerase/dehydratase family protein, partial [Chloroflexia bacterium]